MRFYLILLWKRIIIIHQLPVFGKMLLNCTVSPVHSYNNADQFTLRAVKPDPFGFKRITILDAATVRTIPSDSYKLILHLLLLIPHIVLLFFKASRASCAFFFVS